MPLLAMGGAEQEHLGCPLTRGQLNKLQYSCVTEYCVAFKMVLMKQSEHEVGNDMHIGSHAQGTRKATGQRAGKTLSSESHAECRLYSTTWWLPEELSLELVSGICWKSARSAHTSGIRLSHSSLCESQTQRG